MRVRRFMHTPVTTISSDTLVPDASRLMQQYGMRSLPVVDDGQLVGIITRNKLRDVAPSPATSLSIWELNYLLAKMKVGEVMETKVITIDCNATVEEAMAIMSERLIGSLPVMEKGKLVGMITAVDMFRLLMNIIGVRAPGSRLQIAEPYKKPIGKLSEIMARHGAKPLSVFTFTDPVTKTQDMIWRIDLQDASEVVKDMKAEGYDVVVD